FIGPSAVFTNVKNPRSAIVRKSEYRKTNQNNQNSKKTNTTKSNSDKDKITRAYNTLGVKPDTSPEKIKQAYKKLVKKWHPDLFVNQPQELIKAKEKIRLINEAYGILNESVET
ncbi:MAG: DnaJ domain-containing protein, partial [Cyanobacteria bacterium J06628_3]